MARKSKRKKAARVAENQQQVIDTRGLISGREHSLPVGGQVPEGLPGGRAADAVLDAWEAQLERLDLQYKQRMNDLADDMILKILAPDERLLNRLCVIAAASALAFAAWQIFIRT